MSHRMQEITSAWVWRRPDFPSGAAGDGFSAEKGESRGKITGI